MHANGKAGKAESAARGVSQSAFLLAQQLICFEKQSDLLAKVTSTLAAEFKQHIENKT